ncbi:LOG family protein [Pseudomonadota bacterium]
MTEKNRVDSHHVKTVAVFASSSSALKPAYYDAARRTGEVLAVAGKSIIYGAGGGGLMGAMADGALNKKGKVYGVVPQFLQDLELTHRRLTGLKIVGDMRIRKQLMLEDSDAVVTLPGGCITAPGWVAGSAPSSSSILAGSTMVCCSFSGTVLKNALWVAII